MLYSEGVLGSLPRSQTSLSLRKWWARKGGREGERMRDDWEILFSRWRNVQWQMITQFSKRSIDLFVLRILKEKWFFLIQCARRKLFSYNRTGYSIIEGFAMSVPFSCRKIIEETASDLLERKKSCTTMMFAMYLLHAGGLLEYCRGNKPFVITVSTSSLFVIFNACHSEHFHINRLHGKRVMHCNTGAIFAHVLKRG